MLAVGGNTYAAKSGNRNPNPNREAEQRKLKAKRVGMNSICVGRWWRLKYCSPFCLWILAVMDRLGSAAQLFHSMRELSAGLFGGDYWGTTTNNRPKVQYPVSFWWYCLSQIFLFSLVNKPMPISEWRSGYWKNILSLQTIFVPTLTTKRTAKMMNTMSAIGVTNTNPKANPLIHQYAACRHHIIGCNANDGLLHREKKG